MEDILSKIEKLTYAHDKLSPEIIEKKNIKLGLRNADGTGVVVGITQKGRVLGYKKGSAPDEGKIPVEGKLYYCGYDIEDLVEDSVEHRRFVFDEVVFLLLTGELPSKDDLARFSKALAKRRSLSRVEKGVMMEEVQNDNQMYGLHSVVSHLSRCDNNPDSTHITDLSRQLINLIAKFPSIVAYNYNFLKYKKGKDLKLLKPKSDLSTAENFLYMLKGTVPDKNEAYLFDAALILHAEHGGGNNSTFTVRTVSSSGANTYMAIAAGIASLSGHLHGGANESVMKMMGDLKNHVSDWDSDKQIKTYLEKILDKKAGDGTGKIYGLGHAVYTKSDPRACIFKNKAEHFARERGAIDEFMLFKKVEDIATKLLTERKNTAISANVDFYSGLIYQMMGIPPELFTPIFAMARIAGWSAHRLEQIVQGKIIRPAYLTASTDVRKYKPIAMRKGDDV